jgi:hypothetical protein
MKTEGITRQIKTWYYNKGTTHWNSKKINSLKLQEYRLKEIVINVYLHKLEIYE